MASLLVHTVVRDGQPTEGSTTALATARRIATTLGATLHAAVAPGADTRPDAVAAALGRAGADTIEVLPRADEGPLRWSCTGPALLRRCEALRPRLILFGAADGLGDVAARLAAGLGAGFFAEAQLRGDRKDLTLERFVDARRGALRLRLAPLRAPLVATISGVLPRLADGDDDVDLRVLEAAAPDGQTWLGGASDDADPLARASIVVSIGAPIGPRERALAADLARALGGELAGTAGAYRRGHVPLERAVGVGGRRIAPRLYVACGASGSPHHLAGLSPATEIVALNRDPTAAIFRAARVGMVGELAELLPRVIASVGAGAAS